MEAFEEIFEQIKDVVLQDHEDSEYHDLRTYWQHHKKYWKSVFSEDFFKQLDKYMWEIVF